ncbi:methylated-DNA--[protein]-cysteine S-methyltransferase [Candidatus Desulforudis audaxviator]|uniref:Methylated-DNA--protein-cysteine methyltransferase n=1 Tax=Desulforudis audaxviator (strain MP104C) TaxID=477974 RepID=B1I4Z2_DESAP|nr:methylated-DNA--[protein]-cysteine S-methyltransferase [Candidatus Desulforudis audaxviator]ACA60035.1 methylated-DNA--protein-cysteine methyltransferase [Candidatus Desulforudis audaxviator MP104C]AZK60068.1 Methylated-DNA--protein-cysteine methyltransferase [Candidatus Desulforudis audaxviator]
MPAVVVRLQAGWIGFARTESGLRALTFPQAGAEAARAQLASLGVTGEEAVLSPEPLDRLLTDRLETYFSGRAVDFDLIPVDWSGYTPFQRAVLEAVREVPWGETRTYGELARLVGRPRASRAVGNALGTNRTPLVVPCHRIIRAGGALGGFGGGPELKDRLLRLEGGDSALHGTE